MPQAEEYSIVESDTAVGQQLAQAVKQIFPESGAIPTYKLGAVVGTYAGPGTAGIAFVIPHSG